MYTVLKREAQKEKLLRTVHSISPYPGLTHPDCTQSSKRDVQRDKALKGSAFYIAISRANTFGMHAVSQMGGPK